MSYFFSWIDVCYHSRGVGSKGGFDTTVKMFLVKGGVCATDSIEDPFSFFP